MKHNYRLLITKYAWMDSGHRPFLPNYRAGTVDSVKRDKSSHNNPVILRVYTPTGHPRALSHKPLGNER